jgi:hypothetical protein
MIVELEFDLLVEMRFLFSTLPVELLEAVGENKQALYDATAPPHGYGAEGAHEIEVAGRRFLVFVRSGGRQLGEGGQAVEVVRILHIIENTAAR